MKNIRAYLMIGVLGALLTGCATISNQTTQSVSITTGNGKSVVATINRQKMSLPTEVEISRVDGAVVQVLAQDNKCYESTQLVIKGKDKISGWFWANILTGGTTGSTTDAVSGGMWEYANQNFIVPVDRKPNCN